MKNVVNFADVASLYSSAIELSLKAGKVLQSGAESTIREHLAYVSSTAEQFAPLTKLEQPQDYLAAQTALVEKSREQFAKTAKALFKIQQDTGAELKAIATESAEKFSPNPYGAEPGMRLYRSGDLARWLHDGNIEFSGRMDHQVKVRGFRIELGEIEGVLSQHPAVQEAVVVVRDLGTDSAPPTIGEKQLVGYVVPEQGVSPGVSELRAFLGKKLPNYMIPSAFVVLESLPLTLSGKVDRKALLAIEPGRSELEGVYVPARTSTEELLVSIWEKVLGVKGVGIRDNFFELGGHSLLATQVISRVDAAFRVTIPLRDFFEAPTVAGLAQLIQTTRWVDTAGRGLGPTDDDTEEVTF